MTVTMAPIYDHILHHNTMNIAMYKKMLTHTDLKKYNLSNVLFNSAKIPFFYKFDPTPYIYPYKWGHNTGFKNLSNVLFNSAKIKKIYKFDPTPYIAHTNGVILGFEVQCSKNSSETFCLC
jgi:hypothetical protein